MPWTTLNNETDWVKYKAELSHDLGVPVTAITWGNDPRVYPCLVSTLFPPRPAECPPRAFSAFVYENDCEELFRACGRRFVDADAAPTPTQDQFNRWLAAGFMALAHYEVATGLCAPGAGQQAGEKAFEDKLLEMLELVDAHRAEQQPKKAVPGYATTILDSLDRSK